MGRIVLAVSCNVIAKSVVTVLLAVSDLISEIVSILARTESNIAEILASDKPVLIDFWATWCGPCRALAPIVEEIAEEFDGKAVVAKCNVDDCSGICMSYGIRNIPTLIYFKDGKVVERTVGVVPKADIAAKLTNLI